MPHKKSKPSPPKNIYVRYVENGNKVSVGEYMRAKWFNIVDPFSLTNVDAVRDLRVQIDLYKTKTKREVVLVNYRGSGPAEALTAAMDKV